MDNVLSVNRILVDDYPQQRFLPLHMLNFILGDETFLKVLGTIWNAKQYNYAVTRICNRIWKPDRVLILMNFFNDWFVGEGFPQYDIVWQHKPDGKLYIQAFQTTSHPSVGFMRCRCLSESRHLRGKKCYF